MISIELMDLFLIGVAVYIGTSLFPKMAPLNNAVSKAMEYLFILIVVFKILSII